MLRGFLMKKVIDIKTIEKCPKLLEIFFSDSFNYESDLYFDGSIVYKILKDFLRSCREKVIFESSQYQWEYLVPLFDMLYGENGTFYGYSMPLLTNPTLKQRLGKIPFQSKLVLINHLKNAFLELYQEGFIYVDWHTSNILINPNFFPTLLDRDSIMLKSQILYGHNHWIVAQFWEVLTSILFDADFSCNKLALQLAKLMGLQDLECNFSFFDSLYFQKLLGTFESLGEDFFKKHRGEALALVLK